MSKMQPQAVEQITLTVTKAASCCGVVAASWSWIGQNHHQLSVIFGFICTALAIWSFIKGRSK